MESTKKERIINDKTESERQEEANRIRIRDEWTNQGSNTKKEQ